MPEVTLLKPQKNGKRVNVYLDGKFSFGIDLDNLVLNHIKIGTVLTDDEVEKIIRKADFQKTLNKLLKFAMLRPRSEKEINDYLKRKKVHESIWKDLIDKLRHFELLNDLKFARWWVEQRLAFKKISLKVLKLELIKKGIKKDIIDEVIDEAPIDEEKMARELLEKRSYKWDGLDEREIRQKKFRYLAGKGFNFETVEKILSED